MEKEKNDKYVKDVNSLMTAVMTRMKEDTRFGSLMAQNAEELAKRADCNISVILAGFVILLSSMEHEDYKLFKINL